MIGEPGRAGHNVLCCARHHACEAMGSYVLEGALAFFLSAEAAELRRSTAVTIVPMVDLDGVEAGDQGKGRAPHDHNRDYIDAPLYPEVRAVQQLMAELAGRNLAAYLDFHAPWIRGGANESVFFAEPPEPFAGRLHEFAAALKAVNRGAIPYTGRFDIPHGTSWNVPTEGLVNSTDYAERVSARTLLFSATLETSYSIAEAVAVTPEGARGLGQAVGRALAAYLTPGAGR